MAQTSKAPKEPSITVHFYPDDAQGFPKTVPLYIQLPQEGQAPLVCEHVCIKSAQHLSQSLRRLYRGASFQEIGPAYLPMFGLYALDHNKQLWIDDAQVFTEPQGVYFRIKLRPAKDKIPEGIIMDYLYLQCSDDFRSGRIWTHFDDNKIKDIPYLSISIVYELLSSGRYLKKVGELADVLNTPLKDLAPLETIRKKIGLLCLKKMLPKSLPADLRKELSTKDPLDLYMMRRKLCADLEDFYNGWGWKEQTLGDMRQQYLKEMLYTDVPCYGLEFYKAKRVEHESSSGSDVEAIIRPYQDGCSPGLYFNKNFICPLGVIISMKIEEKETSRTVQACCVQITRRTGNLIVLEFETTAAAKSFASVLKSYYRMQVNFYDDLTENQETSPTLRILQAIRSFGPTREEAARKLLTGPESPNGSRVQQETDLGYAVFQDWQKFNLLHVWGGGEGNGGGRVVCDIELQPKYENEQGVTFNVKFFGGNPEKTFISASDLRRFLCKQYGRQSIPRDEKCMGMECLEEEDLVPYSYYTSTNASARSVKSSDQPCLFEERDIDVNDRNPIYHGEFADVFAMEDKQNGRDVIIKKLKDSRLKVIEAYQRGMAHLHGLRCCNPPIFLSFYGTMLAPPQRFIMECAPGGSLQDRMKDTSLSPVNFLQMGTVLEKLGNCLYDLKVKKMTYGSFCCEKILIYKETVDVMRIRLGDPGKAFYLDTQPITDPLNQQRLPWVAVERFENLSNYTIESEMYALGTVIWEMLWAGRDPKKEIPFSVQEFFAKGNMLPDPLPSPAQTWVNTQDFEVNGNVSVSHYCQGAAPDRPTNANEPQSTAPHESTFAVSTLASSDASSADAPDSGRSTGTSSNSGIGDSGEGGEHLGKEKIIEDLVQLMKRCWNREPNERPSPADFIKAVHKVLDLARRVKEQDPMWQMHLFLEIAKETDVITNESAAEQLRKFLADRQNQGDPSAEERLDMRQLLNECSPKFIHESLLRFPENEQLLGTGQYGRVLQAFLLPASESRRQHAEEQARDGILVAVKEMSGDGINRDNKELFVKEALVWSKLTHPTAHENIVMLHGIILPSLSNPPKPLQLVMESADYALEAYIKAKKPQLGLLAFKQHLRKLAVDVAKGMEFLSSKRLTHGDLAARNILLFNSGKPNVTAKISDFGLAHWLKEGVSEAYYRLNRNIKIPVYWMAMEVLEANRFNSKTDVWSFGTVLWEMTSGKEPYIFTQANILPGEVMTELKHKYKKGERLPKPEYCSSTMYNIMKSCWCQDPSARPEFSFLVNSLEGLTDQELE